MKTDKKVFESLPQFRIIEASGRVVVGPVRGRAGMVTSVYLLQSQVRLANRYRALRIFEPIAGHCAVYPHFGPSMDGEMVMVCLRGAKVERVRSR